MIVPATTQLITATGSILISPSPYIRENMRLETEDLQYSVCMQSIRTGDAIRIGLNEIDDAIGAMKAAKAVLQGWKSDGLPEALQEMLGHNDYRDGEDDRELEPVTD